MTAEWAESTTPGPASHAIPGKTLAAQREALGWSVEQVAEQLKLAVRQVVAIEAGDYAALPGPAVVRGFIRAYAKVVRLDAGPLVALIATDTPAPSDATATRVRRDKNAAFSEVRFPSNGKRAPLPYGAIAALLALGVAAFAAWHFNLLPAALLRGEAPVAAPPAASAPPAGLAADKPVADKPVAAQLETTLVKPDQELGPLPSASVALISVPPPTVAAVAPGETPAAAAAPGALVIVVHEDSWIELRSAKGAPLIARLVKGGTTESFEVNQALTLKVGKPSAVSVTLRGAAVALPPLAGSSISRVNLK